MDRDQHDGGLLTDGRSPAVLRVALLLDTIQGGGGMGRYAREVLRGLSRRTDVELVVVVPRGAQEIVARLDVGQRIVGHVTIHGQTRIAQGLWERHRLEAALAHHEVDVVHGMKHLVPRGDLPTVLTVHDVLSLTWPQQFGLLKRKLLPRQYRGSLRDATVLVAVSGTTRDRLVAVDSRLATKTVVAPNGFTPHLRDVPPVPIPSLADRPFALVVGDLSPRKNIGFLLDLWPDLDGAGAELVLAVVGPDGSRSRATRRRLGHLTAAGLAVRPGRVDDGALRWCYEHACVLLVPTLEEGFGLPVVEAAAFALPTIANPEPALLEAGQGWPTFVPLTDRSGWVDAIVETMTTGRTHRAPSVTFPTWDDHIAILVDAYRRAVDPRFG